MTTILLDCDDVLLDWVSSFRRFCAVRHGVKFARAEPCDWSMSEWLGVSDDEALLLVKRFNRSSDFEYLMPVEGAAEVVLDLALDHELHVVTSCSSDAITTAARKRNLMRHFGPVFDSVTCLDLGAPKAPVLAQFDAGVWIEDNYRHAVAGVEAGHRTFMRRRPHNVAQEATSHPEITWFTEWSEVLAHLKGE